MSPRWCRLYSDLIDDPKLMETSLETFQIFIYCLCLAAEESSNDGTIRLNIKEMAWRFRKPFKTVSQAVSTLITLNILENNGEKIRISAWPKRQFISDNSTARVRNWRTSMKDRGLLDPVTRKRYGNIVETFPETPPDTEYSEKPFDLVPKTEDENGKEQKKPIPKKKAKLSPINPNLFDKFWKVYPKKQKKEDAIKAWNDIDRFDADEEMIITKVELNIVANPQWHKERGQFIPYPASWIRAKRWNDEVVIPHLGELSDKGLRTAINAAEWSGETQ